LRDQIIMTTLEYLLEQMHSLDYVAKKQLYDALGQELVREETKEIIRKYREGAKYQVREVKDVVSKLHDNERI